MENDKELEVLYSEKTMAASSKEIQEVEDKIAGKLLEKQRKEYENKLEHLKNIKKEKGKFPLAPMGVLAPGSAHARPSAQPPVNTSGNLSAHMSWRGF